MEAKRAKIIGLFQGGKSATEICKSLKEDDVCRKLVYRTVKRYRETHFCPFGVKINAKTYRELILDAEVKDTGRKHFRNTNWTFQQDGTSAHTANATQQWFRTKYFQRIMATFQFRSESHGLLCLVHS